MDIPIYLQPRLPGGKRSIRDLGKAALQAGAAAATAPPQTSSNGVYIPGREGRIDARPRNVLYAPGTGPGTGRTGIRTGIVNRDGTSSPLSAMGSPMGPLVPPRKSMLPDPVLKPQQPFDAARADGGPVRAGRPYLVGERGPEVIVPEQSGTVVPNHVLQAQARPAEADDAAEQEREQEHAVERWGNAAPSPAPYGHAGPLELHDNSVDGITDHSGVEHDGGAQADAERPDIADLIMGHGGKPEVGAVLQGAEGPREIGGLFHGPVDQQYLHEFLQEHGDTPEVRELLKRDGDDAQIHGLLHGKQGSDADADADAEESPHGGEFQRILVAAKAPMQTGQLPQERYAAPPPAPGGKPIAQQPAQPQMPKQQPAQPMQPHAPVQHPAQPQAPAQGGGTQKEPFDPYAPESEALKKLSERFAAFPEAVKALKEMHQLPTGRLIIEKLASVADKIHAGRTMGTKSYIDGNGVFRVGRTMDAETVGHEFQHLGEMLFNTPSPFLDASHPEDAKPIPGTGHLDKEFRAMRIQNQLRLERARLKKKDPLFHPYYYFNDSSPYRIPGSLVPLPQQPQPQPPRQWQQPTYILP